MTAHFSYKVSQISKIVKGKRYGPDVKIFGLANPDSDARGKAVFIFRDQDYKGNGTCLVVSRRIEHPATQIVVTDTRYALYLFLKNLAEDKQVLGRTGNDVVVGPFSLIGGDVIIGDGSVIGPYSVVQSATIGKRVVVGPGTIIGWPGFGFIKKERRLLRMEHIGRVIIKDQVEIGSNVVVDRGTFEDTIIGARTKIDSLVHIAHNVRIGKDCVIIAQAGIAGSSKIGDQVFIAGQAGIKEGVRIGDNSKILAKAGVFKSFPKGSIISGIPAREHREMLKVYARLFRDS